MITIEEAIARRRAIRRFKPAAVPDEMLQKLLESARLAPSGCNRQPWRFIVVRNPETKRKLREYAHGQRIIEEAPCVLVCCADLMVFHHTITNKRREEMRQLGIYDDIGPLIKELPAPAQNISEVCGWAEYGKLNCTIAIEHIVLRAVSLGLGTCWVLGCDFNDIQKFFNLPTTTIVVALIPVGFPDQDPPPRPRLPLEEIVLQPTEKEAFMVQPSLQ